jgi:hypothetical protein
MPPRHASDLDVPAPPREDEPPLPADVRQFPLILRPHVVFEMAQRQRERATEKAVARHERKRRRRILGKLFR